jgi:hypothetical protein
MLYGHSPIGIEKQRETGQKIDAAEGILSCPDEKRAEEKGKDIMII